MAAAHVGQEARGNSLKQLRVVDQAAAAKAALDQVMAEDAVGRKSPAKHRLEGVDVVDSFADIAASGKNVLVNVACLSRIRIDARIAGRQPAKDAAARVGDRCADARLKDGMALDDRARGRIDFRPVQRMRHAADQFLANPRRQPRVRIQGDHITD